jgi:hypothetical protein
MLFYEKPKLRRLSNLEALMEEFRAPLVIFCLLMSAVGFISFIRHTERSRLNRHQLLMDRIDQLEKRITRETTAIEGRLKDLKGDVHTLLFPELYEERRQEQLDSLRRFEEEFSPEGIKQFMDEESAKET